MPWKCAGVRIAYLANWTMIAIFAVITGAIGTMETISVPTEKGELTMAKADKQKELIATIQRAICIIEGVAFSLEGSASDGLTTAVEMLDEAYREVLRGGR